MARGRNPLETMAERARVRNDERSTLIASTVLVEAIRASGRLDRAVELFTRPGALAVNHQALTPSRFMRGEVRPEVDLEVAGDWRIEAVENVSPDRLGAFETDMEVTELPQRVVNATRDEVSRQINLSTRRLSIQPIADNGRVPGAMIIGPLKIYPVVAEPSNRSIRNEGSQIDLTQWGHVSEDEAGYDQRMKRLEERWGFRPSHWLANEWMTPDRLATIQADTEQWRGGEFWKQEGSESFAQWWDKYDPLLLVIDEAAIPRFAGFNNLVANLNKVSRLAVRNAVAAMTDVRVADYLQEVAAGRGGDLTSWLVDPRRIQVTADKLSMLDSSLQLVRRGVEALIEQVLEVAEWSEGQTMLFHPQVLATLGAVPGAFYGGMQVREMAAVSLLATGADPDQISSALKVDAESLRRRR